MWLLALLAGVAMAIQDFLEVLKDQAQARNRPVLAGTFDSLMWLALITTTSISVTALQGHSLHEKIIVILVVTVANFIGQIVGVLTGKRFIK